MAKITWMVVWALVLQLELVSYVFAGTNSVRWTGSDDQNAEFSHVLDVIRAKTGFAYNSTDFRSIEDRELAHNRFRIWVQQSAGVPIRGKAIRLWTDLSTGALIQAEAALESPGESKAFRLLFSSSALRTFARTMAGEETLRLVRAAVAKNLDDSIVRGASWEDMWDAGDLVRVVKAKGRRGNHVVVVSLSKHRVLSVRYAEFPKVDELAAVPVQIYPVYEEVELTNEMLGRIPGELKYLNAQAARPSVEPFGPLREHNYFDNMFDAILGQTEEGRAEGYWAMSWIKQEAARLAGALPVVDNSFANGTILEGRYATVSFHPNAMDAFGSKLLFTPGVSTHFYPLWEGRELVPTGTVFGRPLASAEDAMNRPARRLPDHDPVSYINDGFDEIQVYWAITQLFESLRPMGFTDPELSTRPFNAFLYDPDIGMRDNAYYTDDTINFTTYSPREINYARDNSTIWHELGHGVMDRLMGDQIQLADTGGLSEGMADLIAQLVILDVMKGLDFTGAEYFRIINQTGFFLTNETHDDGEAYGGAMNDFVMAAIRQYGRPGLAKATDLVLETMRLCRDHPALTAQDWFGHMLFADQLGNAGVRGAGELGSLLIQALSGRNFVMGTGTPAAMIVMHDGEELTSQTVGSRGNPVTAQLALNETAGYHLDVSIKNGSNYQFRFPVKVKVEFRTGPLQGAVHWVGEESSPAVYTIRSENETLPIDLQVSGKCDFANREDGSCVDYAYVQIWNDGERKLPQAKKRFYVHVMQKAE